MELLKRYLQAVGEHLPRRGREDTLAELRANLESEIEAREEELDRSLTEAEVAAILEAHGMPVLVASRYGSQHFLIGPTLFPVYWYTLKRSFPLVVLAYAVVQLVGMFLGSGSADDMGRQIWVALGHFPGVALTFWGIVTLGFSVFEYGQGRFFPKLTLPKWSVRDLPPLENQEEKKHSLASGVADLIVSVLIVVWLLAVPSHPYLILGPGTRILHGVSFGLTPEWHVFYWQIMGLLMTMIPLKALALLPSMRRARGWLQLGVSALGIIMLVIMVQVRAFFAAGPGASAESVHALVGINAGVTLGFKLVLAMTVVKFAWDLWKELSAGQHRRRDGYATVL
jgi:hypothetical protein